MLITNRCDLVFFFQLFEKFIGFSRPGEDKDDEEAYPGLPPAFHPLMEKVAEQEKRYWSCVSL